MNTKITSIACGVVLTLATTVAPAATSTTTTNFNATDSLFGLSAGFNINGDTRSVLGNTLGIEYGASANTGTVNAGVNGSIRATYDDVINGSSTNVALNYLGGLSSLSSAFGANAFVDAFVNVTIPIPFLPDFPINATVNILDEGFFLAPSRTFNANLGVGVSDTDQDTAAAPAVTIVPVPVLDDVAAGVDLDIRQTIRLTPNSLDGILRGVNRSNGNVVAQGFGIGASDFTSVALAGLDAGIWDFSILDIDLFGLFRNDVSMVINPFITLPVFSDFRPGTLATIPLFGQEFGLDFNTLTRNNVFSILVTPIPAAIWLFGTALLGFIGMSRRRIVA